jgi:hypothetical protein
MPSKIGRVKSAPVIPGWRNFGLIGPLKSALIMVVENDLPLRVIGHWLYPVESLGMCGGIGRDRHVRGKG